MIISIVVILAACIVLSMLMLKRVVIHSVIIKMLGVCLIAFSTLEYVVKFSSYLLNTGLEQNIYFKLVGIDLTVPQLAIIMNLGVSMLLLSSVFFVRKHLKKQSYFVLLVVGVIFFFGLNYPKVCERLYILSFKPGSPVNDASLLLIYKAFNIIMVAFYAALPYLIYGYKCFKTGMHFKKKRYLMSMGIILLMDILFYGNFVLGNFREYFIFNLNLLKYPISNATLAADDFTLGYTIVMLMVVFFAILIAKPFGKFGVKNWYISLADEMSTTVSMMLHGYKNAFVAIEMFADEKNSSFLGDSEKRLEKIMEIARLNEGKIKDIINIINMQNKITLSTEKLSLDDLVQNAVSDMRKDNTVDIVVDSERDLKITADRHHLTETLVCILNNAYESFSEMEEEKRIIIKTGCDGRDAYIQITDNGCGIENTKKIFNAFYSSKMGGKNFGIGLTYAKQIMEAHDGVINIKSRLGEGTEVQLLLLNALK